MNSFYKKLSPLTLDSALYFTCLFSLEKLKVQTNTLLRDLKQLLNKKNYCCYYYYIIT